MGSRAVIVVCRDESVAPRRFDIEGDGVIVTRTGRPFFTDQAMGAEVLARVRAAVDKAGLWESLATDWLVLDAELLPWSVKAEELLRRQYASVGMAAAAALSAEAAVWQAASARGVDVGDHAGAAVERAGLVASYIEAYGHYCWPVASVDDLRIAPFQVLAGEGGLHALKPHDWHLSVLAGLAEADPALLQPTAAVFVELGSDSAEAAAIEWWEDLTGRGGEGMVVKPVDVVHRGPKGLAQPGIKCRGREYLRIIYGPEYTRPEHLERLRTRSVGRKRGLAVREFALGIEALERFVAGEPLHRVHECVFGVLALESEPVDPRL